MLSAPKIILMGPPGAGKTTSLSTLLRAGIEVFVLVTEPGGIDALLDACKKGNIPIERLHWHYVAPVDMKWATMSKLATTINTSSFEDIAKMQMGIEKRQTTNIMKLLDQLQNFTDERTGTSFGDVTEWGPDRAIVIDSLTGLNHLVMQNTVGLKPNPAPGEWNIAQTFEANIINLLASNCRCYFILLAHIDRTISETTGAMLNVPAAIGAKLGPKLGAFFGDVILAKRATPNAPFVWSTLEASTDVKNRILPVNSTLSPDFTPFVLAHRERIKLLDSAASKNVVQLTPTPTKDN